MVAGTSSGCINHPGYEAVGRCKQCGKAFCATCRVQGPTGNFCSTACKEKHEAFIQRVQQQEQRRKGGRMDMLKRALKSVFGKIVILAILVLAIGFVASVFNVQIPVLSGIIEWIRGLFGI